MRWNCLTASYRLFVGGAEKAELKRSLKFFLSQIHSNTSHLASFTRKIIPLASSIDENIKKCTGSFIGDNQLFTAFKVHRDINCLLKSLPCLQGRRESA